MDLQDTFDDLDNIVITLTMLIRETRDKYFIDMLKELKNEATDKRNEVEEILWQDKKKEISNQNIEFDKNRI